MFQNAATTTKHFTSLLGHLFDPNRMFMKRHGTMWDQTDGCGKQAVDTPGHGKDVVDGFNAVQKLFLQTCLRKTSMPE
eukprot:scaffold105141_cov47-Attheya_sp.AAC.1